MANKFNIIISATDRASAVVRRFNANFNNLLRPLTRTNESFRRLNREIGKNALVKGLGNIGKVAKNVASNIFSIGGAIAGVTLATSAVAVVDWMRNWAGAGVQLQNFSAITGQATGRILTLRGAAKYLGLSADDLDGSLKNLGDTLEDATYGRNQQALALMNRLHISMKRTKEGAVDSAAALSDVAAAIVKIKNVQAQALVARAFGVEALLPMLQKGPAGIAALEAQARRAGATITPEQLLGQQKTQTAFTNVGIAAKNLTNAIGVRITPLIQATADSLTNWESIISTGKAVDIKKSPAGRFDSWFTQGAERLASRAHNAIFGAPRGIRNNNPGNLRTWGSQPRVDGYATFGTPQEGLSALAGQLSRYASRGINMLASIVKTYAPSSDGNDVASYIKDLVKKTGFGADQKLNMKDPKVLGAVERGIIQHENGQQPYSESMIDDAVKSRLAKDGGETKAHVVVEFKNAPKGTTVAAKSAAGEPLRTTLKIDYALPTDVSPP